MPSSIALISSAVNCGVEARHADEAGREPKAWLRRASPGVGVLAVRRATVGLVDLRGDVPERRLDVAPELVVAGGEDDQIDVSASRSPSAKTTVLPSISATSQPCLKCTPPSTSSWDAPMLIW